MTNWQIITGEYPPQPGGVSDYTRIVANGLASAGDSVVVWAPPLTGGASRPHASHLPGGATDGPPDPGIEVRRLPDRFGARSLRLLSARAESHEPASSPARPVRAARIRVESREPAVLSLAALPSSRLGVGDVPRGRVSLRPARRADAQRAGGREPRDGSARRWRGGASVRLDPGLASRSLAAVTPAGTPVDVAPGAERHPGREGSGGDRRDPRALRQRASHWWVTSAPTVR